MTRLRLHLEFGRRLLARHVGSGQMPTDTFRVFLAELEAALDATPEPTREIEALGERTQLERDTFGFPAEMNRP